MSCDCILEVSCSEYIYVNEGAENTFLTDKRNQDEKESNRRFKTKIQQINGTWSNKIVKASQFSSTIR